MKTVKVSKATSVENIINNTFVFCTELNKGFIKRDLSFLNITDYSFENVINQLEQIPYTTLYDQNTDSILFGLPNNLDIRGEIEISHRFEKYLEHQIRTLNTTNAKTTFLDNWKTKRRYFDFDRILLNTNGVVTTDDQFTIYQGRKEIIPFANILANDFDTISDGLNPLTIIAVDTPINGTVIINGTNVEFTNTTGEIGAACSFKYTAKNLNNDTQIGTVTLTILEVPPIVCNPETYNLQQGETLLISKSSLLNNDTDGLGKTLSVIDVRNPINGTVNINGDNISFTSTGISGFPAEFEYVVENTDGLTGIGKVFINVTQLPAIEAYIYPDTVSVQSAISSGYVPPSIQDIFDSWSRFSGDKYYVDKAAAVAANDTNATAWQFLQNPDRISMPLNVDPANGFISADLLENFTFEATLKSSDIDNDTNGLIIAFKREGTTNHILALAVSGGGSTPTSGYALIYFTNNITYADTGILVSKTYLGKRGAWSNGEIRLKIQREGSIIKCYGTNWNDTDNYQVASEIVFDLNSNANTQRFVGPQPYGYMTFSQPNSTYLDISFNGGLDVSKIFDIENNTTWEYINGQWVDTGVTLQQSLGYVRDVINPSTGITYTITGNEIIVKS